MEAIAAHVRTTIAPQNESGDPKVAIAALLRHPTCFGFKIETEEEGATADDILQLQHWVAGAAPLVLKIGGVNARADLRFAQSWSITHLVAPMVESPYGVENFRAAVDAVFESTDHLELAINIETIGACQRLEDILRAAIDHRIARVTIGRSDLSGSMSASPEDDTVSEWVRLVSSRARVLGLGVTMGGRITPEAALDVNARFPAVDRVETRNVVFTACDGALLSDGVREGLAFEILQLQARRQRCTQAARSLSERIADIERRLSESA